MNESIGPVFADTNYWVALAFNQDQYHGRAIRWVPRIRGPIITTTAVLIETGNALSKQPTRQECVRLIDYIRGHRDIHVVQLSDSLFEQGWQLFKDQSARHGLWWIAPRSS